MKHVVKLLLAKVPRQTKSFPSARIFQLTKDHLENKGLVYLRVELILHYITNNITRTEKKRYLIQQMCNVIIFIIVSPIFGLSNNSYHLTHNYSKTMI